MELTATRTWKGDTALLTITFPDGTSTTAGGKRAARAAAVIVAAEGDKPLTFRGARGSLAAAQTEVHRMLTATTMRHGGATLTFPPSREAYAVPVTEVAR
jgi:hypothetical protein